MEQEETKKLKVVMFPWLAIGHLIPYFQLSKLLAQKGHHIYFISTPRNLSRLPTIPSHLSSKITIISFPLPHVPSLPPHAESSADVSYNHQQLLKKANDLLQSPITNFIKDLKPDWVIYDYASHWLPLFAATLNISCGFFSLFAAATLSFIGPASLLINGTDYRSKAEDFTVVPKWVPFESNVAYYLHEVSKYVEKTEADQTGVPDTVRFGLTIDSSDVVIIRSSPELEPEWFDLLGKLYQKPVIPVGFLPREREGDGSDCNSSEKLGEIREWLDRQDTRSVVYVALGTEVALTKDEVTELALGLEKSTLPFLWVMKSPPESTQTALEMLPEGFVERVKGRGAVYAGWAPQVEMLSHDSVGGFLTHCGWNSVIEGLTYGKVLLLFPCMNDQGLNARLLSGKKIGLEIPRNETDGLFTSDSVSEYVRMAMVEESGEDWRAKAKEMSNLFGDGERNNRFVDRLLKYMIEKRLSQPMS